MAVRAPLRALLALTALAVAEGQSSYRTSEDNEAVAAAQTAVSTDCAGVDLSSLDRDDRRGTLSSFMNSDDNIILKILRESENTDQMAEKAQEEITPAWLIKTAGAMVFSFLLIGVYFICCWTACPSCECCLCCRRKQEEKSSMLAKLVLLAVLGALLFGMVVSAMLAVKGKQDIDSGMDSISCTAARTMYHTLEGQTSEQFIGILPMLDQLSSIRNSLTDTSSNGMLSQVQNIIQNTAGLERSQFVAVQALLLLQETLELPENRNQQGVQTAIDQILPPIQQVNSQLGTSLGTALANARAEVDNQLSSANRASMADAVDSAVEPLRESADTVRDSLWFFIKEDFRNIKDMAILAAGGGIIAIACIIFLLAACALMSGLLCTFREYDETKAKEGEKNPWNKNVARCSLTSWCCGFLYAFLVFFFGGIMVICAVPMASMCLVMDDITGQMLMDIMPALGVDVQGDSFNMVGDIIDNCFSRLRTGPPQSLMEIVRFEENGVSTSLAAKLQSQTVDPIDAQFSAITTQLNTGSANLATDSNIVQLKNELQSFSWPPSAPLTNGFRCDIFETSLGFDCDVKDMTGDVNDCVTGTNPLAMTKKAKTCNSAQFVTYMNLWATRIDKVLVRLDSSVASTGTEISTNLRSVVSTHILAPITNITSQSHCSFLGNEYQDLVAGFCFQGVIGFGSVARAYVANGVLTLLMIIVAYTLWRINIDNRRYWEDVVKPLTNEAQEKA